ncbi:O-antigen ligase family protein [Lactiplantibacillus daowaiensis]|uniref:O-antigen ligase family protein n=1 Tax=Lactiplantibacillus daowaiensis TaxID=2559918 RepID=A0ABW1S233_9LACO|nr:O-antigen ligase family protein [Lactiplantibacillus daowaiensis]
MLKKHELTADQFLLGLKLLAILPPIGIGWLVYLSRWQWLKLFRHPKSIWHDQVLCFILLLLGITVLNFNRHDYHSDILSCLMLIVLMNLWLLCRRSAHLLTLAQIRQFIIQFGIYITISGNIFHWLNQWVNLPTWLKFLAGDLLWGYAANQDRLFGSAYNPNDACCLLLIALGLFLAQFGHQTNVIGSSHHQRYLDWLTTSLLMIGIYQTQSRTGLILMLVLVIGTSYHLNWRYGVMTTLSTALMSAIALNLLPRSYSWGTAWSSRLTIWQNSLALFKNAPWFGVTYFGFAKQYLKLTGTYVPHAHDIFIMLLASFGILGGLGFVALIAANGWHLAKRWQQHQPMPNLRYFGMTLPIILAYGLTDFVLSSMQVLIIILLLVAYWRYEQRQRTTLHLTT